ncbi:hypothetical protein BKA65DRAFT_244034 [Rhexocercosporidium sp. MPI-PUGE-AT-0058]|nr:hypothetical protein BKA65DRAFT_244034 [Rhexocercosporidium sp. MPI-PUGE-AT-0058]
MSFSISLTHRKCLTRCFSAFKVWAAHALKLILPFFIYFVLSTYLPYIIQFSHPSVGKHGLAFVLVGHTPPCRQSLNRAPRYGVCPQRQPAEASLDLCYSPPREELIAGRSAIEKNRIPMYRDSMKRHENLTLGSRDAPRGHNRGKARISSPYWKPGIRSGVAKSRESNEASAAFTRA